MTNYPIINERGLNRLGSELGLEDSTEILRTFLEDTARKIATIAAPGANRSTRIREANAIKSSAALFGFERLYRQAQDVEAGVESLDAALLNHSVAKLQTAFRDTAGFAENILLPSLVDLP